MKKTKLLFIVYLLIPILLLSNGFTQGNTAQWHLPEGAKARLGRGRLINLQLSPDGTRVAASTTIGIWIYDAHSGEVISLFTETQTGTKDNSMFMTAQGPPEALDFSADASIIATAHGNTVYAWDTSTGNTLAMLNEHPDSIKALALSPDGTTLATAGENWIVRLWEVRTGHHLGSLTKHQSVVNAVAFSPDGKVLASAGSTLRLWDANSGELLHADNNDLGSVNLLVFSPDGKILASGGGWDHTIHLWDVNTGTLQTGLKGHTDQIRDLAFSPDSRRLITASHDRTMRLWDVHTGIEQKNLPTTVDKRDRFITTNRRLKQLEQGVLPTKRDDVYTVRFSKDGTQIASVSSDGSLHLWDVDTGEYQLSFSLGEHTDWVNILAFSADSKYLVSNNKLDERVRVWNVEDFTQDSILALPQQTYGLTFSANLKRLAGHDYPHAILVWDAETKEELSVVAETWEQDYWPPIFSPNGKILAGSERLYRNKIKLWEADTGDRLFTLEGHTSAVSEYTFSPDSQIIASGDADGTIILWDVKTGKKLTTLTERTERISALAFSTDGKTLASGSKNMIYLWDIRTSDPVGILDAVENVWALEFTPDGKTLTSGSEDGLIQVWELDPNYQIQATFRGHNGAIYVLRSSPDGKTLASGSADGTIILWDLEEISQVNDK